MSEISMNSFEMILTVYDHLFDWLYTSIETELSSNSILFTNNLKFICNKIEIISSTVPSLNVIVALYFWPQIIVLDSKIESNDSLFVDPITFVLYG